MSVEQSSSSLPPALDAVHGNGAGLSWLETPGTASMASSISEDSSEPPVKKAKEAKEAKEAPLWRSFFTGRSRSNHDRSKASPFLSAPSPYMLSIPDSWVAAESQAPVRSRAATPDGMTPSTKTSLFKSRWTTGRPDRSRRNSNASLHEQAVERSSRSSSRNGKPIKDAGQANGLSRPARE